MSDRGILIFDVGKTNKKILVFNQRYELVNEENFRIPETKDNDGFPCEDVDGLTQWLRKSFDKLMGAGVADIRAVNFSGYGASFVCVNDELKPVLPLCNYLKPYPEKLLHDFYDNYGGQNEFSKVTASPRLGNLNSGLQLYQLAKHSPEKFQRVKYALHLPQYLSSILTARAYSDMTSIGCHTGLWNFETKSYHEWVAREGISRVLAEIRNSDDAISLTLLNKPVQVGVGLHDSSAALIPYMVSCHEPFVLLSTGTWNISLNPFNASPLTSSDLEQDCLSYLNYKSLPVRASRLFAGHEHEVQVKVLAESHHKHESFFANLKMPDGGHLQNNDAAAIAYFRFMEQLISKQEHSLNLVVDGQTKKLFVDGGFSKNAVFMHLLSERYKDLEVSAATVPQASALGAALAIHHHWNDQPIPKELIHLKRFNRNSTAV